MQVYQQDTEFYHFGDIDKHGNSQFEGWPWHVIRLPDQYDQHTVYFRIFSDYPFIGLSGEVAIGNRFDLLNSIYQRGITGLSFILVVLLIGIISAVMGAIKKERVIAISTGLLSFNLALMMFAENELSQVILFEPLLWRYAAALCYFLVPVFLSVVILAWLRDKQPLIARGVLAVNIAFVAGVTGLTIFTSYSFINAYPIFDVLFIISVLSLMAGCVKQFRQLGITGNLMTFGILTLFISLLLDMLSAHGYISWIGRSGQWGLILFTITSLAIYLVKDWQQQLALNTFTQQLESKVQSRTAELQENKKQLERLAREDFLTSLLNRRAFTELANIEIAKAICFHRPVSLLLFDLDHFKEVNDKYGHSTGDLILKEVATKAMQTCRDGELICRYGGEEFVILLHATETQYAQILAKRLSTAIKEIEVKAKDQTIKITASFGLISLNNLDHYQGSTEQIMDNLLAEADKMMYDAKISGRDLLKVSELSAV